MPNNDHYGKNFAIGAVLVALFMILGGFFAHYLTDQASGIGKCPEQPTGGGPVPNASLSGLPATIPFVFGYGRGPQTFETTFAVSPQNATSQLVLPREIETESLPLRTSGGQVLSAASRATRINSTNTYLLQVCINASANGAADPGSYIGSLTFPGTAIPQGSNPIVTATLQSETLPYVLLVGGPPVLMIALLYATMALVRRAIPEVEMGTLWQKVLHNLWSANGVVAFALGIGAAFGVWKAQCYLNPTWGAAWPDIAVGVVSMGVAVVTAVSVPLAFSGKPVE